MTLDPRARVGRTGTSRIWTRTGRLGAGSTRMSASSLTTNGVCSCARRSLLWVRCSCGRTRSRSHLFSVEIPLKDAGSLTTGPSADKQAGFEVGRFPKPIWRITSLARIMVYSMSQDSLPAAPSFAPTPFTPFTPGAMTPMTPPTPQPGANGNLGDYLAHKLATKGLPRAKTYLAGSKALDSLQKLIASTESFFHPSNSGSWTTDVSEHCSPSSTWH
jgi:hypothetical protein